MQVSVRDIARAADSGGKPAVATQPAARKLPRDTRVDVLRGAALLMIFIDHIPGNDLSWFTLHWFGFADAGEVFVLLAGFSAMIAYGRSFARDGASAGLRKIALRCLRIYGTQIALLAATLVLVEVWSRKAGLVVLSDATLLSAGARGVRDGLLLRALPTYLDILPLYIVLLAIFPAIYLLMRVSMWGTLVGSALIWLAALAFPWLDFPNILDPNGWYFDPFSWQFLFTIGIAFATVLQSRGALPSNRWLLAACAVFLVFAFFQTLPWRAWGLPDLRPLAMAPPDKSRLNILRLIDITALFYVVMTVDALRRMARSRLLRPLEACGRHSLYVFAAGCMLAVVGRLAFRTLGYAWPMQVAVNATGILIQCTLALLLERARLRREAAPQLPAAGALPARG